MSSVQWRATESSSERMAAGLETMRRNVKKLRSTLDVRTPPAIERRAFLEDHVHFGREVFEASPAYNLWYYPNDFDFHQRLLAYHGDTFLGWVGLLRRRATSPFTTKDRRRMRPLVRPVIDALTQAHRMERSALPADPADLVMRPDGRLDFAAPAARAWLHLASFHEALAAMVRAVDRGIEEAPPLVGVASPRVVRLEGEGGRVRYLVHLKPAAPVQLSPLAVLSPTQRRVAEGAAAGCTIDEIAQDVGSRPDTVRTHLKTVYRRLEVSNRVELAEVIAGG